jgi:hypothetical protein
MYAPDLTEAFEIERALRRRMYEVAETQHWVHHVADLDSGELVTTPLDRPPTPLSRAERLSQFGHRVDPTVFGWPSQQLTPRQGYRHSPVAWLYAHHPALYSPFPLPESDGVIEWSFPREFESPRLGMQFSFAVPPVGRTVASVTLRGHAYENAQGKVRFIAYVPTGPGQFEVPVDGSFGHHTVDFTFVSPPAPDRLDILMGFWEGIEEMAFAGISVGAEPPWIEPEPPID